MTEVLCYNNLLLSKELFSSAQFELTHRAKLINLISNLEPLAKSKSLDENESKFVSNELAALKVHQLFILSDKF